MGIFDLFKKKPTVESYMKTAEENFKMDSIKVLLMKFRKPLT